MRVLVPEANQRDAALPSVLKSLSLRPTSGIGREDPAQQQREPWGERARASLYLVPDARQ
jgi:hypothetical protein